MKMLFSVLKISLTSIGFIIGVYMSVEFWVIDRANTVVEPVRKEVKLMRSYDKALHENIERELIHIRHYQDEQARYLRDIARK